MGISPSTFRAVVECVIPIPMLRSFEPSSRWPPVLLHVVTPSGLPRAKLLRCPLAEVCRCDLRLCWANGHRGSCFQHHQEPWQLRDVRASEAVSVLRVETTFFHPTPMVDQRFPPWNGHNLKVSHPFFGTHITIITRLTTTIFCPTKIWRFWGHHGEAVTRSKGLDFHQTSSAGCSGIRSHLRWELFRT